MHRILAAVDLSDTSQSVLKFSAELARNEHATLAVLYALPATLPVNALASSWGISMMNTSAEALSDFDSSLKQLQQIAEANGLTEADCLCLRGSAVETIREAAERLHADVIVTGSHGHGRLFHTMFGSVREALLAQAPCPVLVVPKQGKPS
jgi:nucleotide-binding universal stress UspA family protein